MIDILSLSMALSVGQGPSIELIAPPVTPQRVIPNALPVVPQGRPMSLLTADQPPMPLPKDAKDAPPMKGDEKKEEEKKEEEKKEPPKGFFMAALENTAFGQRLEAKKITISGWTEMNYTTSSARPSNLPTTFNDKADEFQMNQNFLRIDKPVDWETKEVQLGGRIEAILPGTDARFTIPRGLFDAQLRNGPNGGPRAYPFDIYQFYSELFLPNIGEGTSVKFGRFATHCSYELVQGAETPFLSRAYGFQYNPFTHTGVWAVTKLSDRWSVGNGLVLGSDNVIDPASRLTYIGQAKYTSEGDKTTILANAVVTNPKYEVNQAFPFYNTYNLQVIEKITDKFTYVLDGTFSHMDNVPGEGSTRWYGVINYFLYQVTEQVASNLRVEYFKDEQGVRTGFRGSYFESTYGISWTPKDWLMIRPFARFDYNADTRPFEGKRDLYTGGLDLIVKW